MYSVISEGDSTKQIREPENVAKETTLIKSCRCGCQSGMSVLLPTFCLGHRNTRLNIVGRLRVRRLRPFNCPTIFFPLITYRKEKRSFVPRQFDTR